MANLTVSTFMMGMALGQFLGGPLSTQVGRKTIGLVDYYLHDYVVTDRVGGGFASVICVAQLRDVFEPHQVGKKVANVVLVLLVAPMLAPTIGTLISGYDWQAIFFALTGFTSVILLIYVVRIPEINHSTPEKFSFKLFIGYWSAISKRSDGRLIAIRYVLFSGFTAGVRI